MVSFNQQTYPTDGIPYGITIKNAYRSSISGGNKDGMISFSGYKVYGLSINSGDISLTSSSGYFNVQDLTRIGVSEGYTTANITVEKTNIIGDKTISYDGASISYNDVYVDGSAGTYTVTIGGVAYDSIEQGDAKLIKKVELN